MAEEIKLTHEFLIKFYLFIYLLGLAVLGLHCCMQTFSSCGAWTSHSGGFSCCRAQALSAQVSVAVAHGWA